VARASTGCVVQARASVELAVALIDRKDTNKVSSQIGNKNKTFGRVEESLVRVRRLLAIGDRTGPGQLEFEDLKRVGARLQGKLVCRNSRAGAARYSY
jgi:hypothetical protein